MMKHIILIYMFLCIYALKGKISLIIFTNTLIIDILQHKSCVVLLIIPFNQHFELSLDWQNGLNDSVVKFPEKTGHFVLIFWINLKLHTAFLARLYNNRRFRFSLHNIYACISLLITVPNKWICDRASNNNNGWWNYNINANITK